MLAVHFTHYRLTEHDGPPCANVQIISWLDDCTRYALHVSAHRSVTTRAWFAAFRRSLVRHGIHASTLNVNGVVYTG